MPWYEDPDTGEEYFVSSPRVSIGNNPRTRTLIKASKKIDKLIKKYYAMFRHAGLIHSPGRSHYYKKSHMRRD